MPEADGQQLEETADLSESPTPPSRSSEQLTRPGQQLTPLNLNAEHQKRMNEATVRERETIAEQAADNRQLRKTIAHHVGWAIAIQIGIADAVFLTYGLWNGWNVPGSTIVAWLSATVVQVIAVGLVVTKSLFPPGSPKDGLQADLS
jgi:hypothetical protein